MDIINENSRPIITLLSDFGINDNYVPIAKAIILQAVQDAKIVDISHSVEEGNLFGAAYLLLSAYNNFPNGTIHIILVDIFTEPNPRLIFTEINGHYFLAPDNCFLSFAFGNQLVDIRNCFEFRKPFVFIEWVNQVAISVGQLLGLENGSISSSGDYILWVKQEIKVVKGFLDPHLKKNEIECNIIYIDRFGNLVLNIQKQQFLAIFEEKPFRINIARMMDITKISKNYNDVLEGEPLCRFNSADFLEIAINRRSMATKLNLNFLKSHDLHYKRIKVFTS